ncbi:MAG: hypothetical protein R6X02_33575 [Enhygromyxa sp.]
MACSIACHIGLAIAASMLPDGGRSGGAGERDRLYTPGAVIPIETVERAVARAEPVVEEPRSPAPTDNPELPAKAPSDHPESSKPAPSSGAAPPEPTEATEAQEPSRAPGLSLHGLRDNARASTTGTGKVAVDPSLLQGSRELYEESVQDAAEAPVQGPAPAPRGKDYAFSKENGKLIYRDPAGRFVATLNPDGRVNFRNKGAKASWTNIGMAGPGDVLAAAAGDDPYARLKAALLKATFDMRLGMAVDFQKRQLDKRLRRLDGELDKIWADERRDLAARKELLFQRWDECDEPDDLTAAAELPGFGALESSELDDARQGAAASARKRILKFIREHAPKGSPEAFTAAELAEMNRRRVSKQKFAPYP